MTICLGIESTAHTFGVGIVDNAGKVLANEKDMYRPPAGWGIHPTEAAKHHDAVKQGVYEAALAKAGLSLKDIDFIAFSQGPGLAPCLHRGLEFAYSLKKPVMGVNHCISHVEIGRLTSGLRDPITLYTSGANTQVLGFVSGRYRCFGETMDIGIGNALDKFGRGAGLEFPAGPKIEQLALESACMSLLSSHGNALGAGAVSEEKSCKQHDLGDGIRPKFIELPYVVKGMDLSFSGIITDALQKLGKTKSMSASQKGIPPGGKGVSTGDSSLSGRTAPYANKQNIQHPTLNDVCFFLQETMFAMLAEVTERALAHTGKSECLLTGGVAANRRLAQMMEIMCRERGAKFHCVPRPLAADNAAMIAWTGILMRKAGMETKREILPRQRTDEVDVKWIKEV